MSLANALPATLLRAVDPCGNCDARSVSVCQGVSDQHIDRLARLVTDVDFSAHHTIVSEGDPATYCYNVTAGTVKLIKMLPDGRQQIVGFLVTGDFIGLGIYDSYRYTAETVTDARVCRFARPKLEELMREFPEMEHRMRALACDELAVAQDQILTLGRKTARERLASFLVQLAKRVERLGGSSDPLSIPMSRADIADYLGLTIETVSRTFSQLRNDKLIRLVTPTEMSILNRAALNDLAEGWR